MGRNTEVARERTGYRLAEHRKSGRPRTPDAFCQALQRAGDRDEMRAMLKAQINKTNRNDARGIAQMMRVGL
jgi:hypothetical protein